MDNKTILRTAILWGLFFCISVDAFAQVSFKAKPSFYYESVNKAKKVGFLVYNGKMTSIAETDTALIPNFEYLSIGKIKRLTVVSKGCVLAIIKYSCNQAIVFETQLTGKSNFSNIDSFNDFVWVDKLTTVMSCALTDEISLKKNRYSFTLVFNNELRIHLINVKKENIELFKYMISTLNFEFPSGVGSMPLNK